MLKAPRITAPSSTMRTTFFQEQQLRRMVLVLFILSGATGLAYEVIWIRLLSLVFGNTVHALSTVLTAFLTGLAAGAYVAGRWIDRHPNPLRIYGLLEGAIGLYCALTPALLKLLAPTYIAVARTWPESGWLFLGVRLVLCFVILLVPTICMGATLPVIAKFYVRRFETVGRGVGLLYGLNTLGAVVGCFAAGFVSLQWIGVSRTLWVAAALNGLIAVTAWVLASQTEPLTSARTSPPVKLTIQARWLLAAFALAGFTSLVYEVVWTRVLVLVIGSTVYAYTTMLTTFILGIGLGSLLVSPLLDRRENLLLWFAGLEAAIGVWAVLSISLFNALPEAFIKGYSLIGPSWGGIVGMKFVFSALVMLPATLAMGGTFPIVCRLYTERLEGLGGSVGEVYAANTAGAIGGSFLSGFVAIPLLGTHSTIVLAAALNALLAGVLCLSARRLAFRFRLGLVAAGALVALPLAFQFTPSWNRQLLAGGAFHLARRFGDNPLEFRQRVLNRELLYFAEGPAATVTVLRTGSLKSLQINGKAVASNHPNDMLNQLYLGHLPVILHPEPRDILIIGLGAGITAGSVAAHPVERIDIVEIAPEVPAAAGLFEGSNRGVLQDPRVNLIIADGRNHLLVTESHYDVITTDPIHPWRAGASSLFTREYYRLARARLKPGGLMCQWLPLYGMDAESVRSVVKTFATVFPHITLWANPSAATSLLIGTNQPISIDVASLARRFERPPVRADLARIEAVHPWTLLAGFLFNEQAVAAYANAAPLNTDDRPLLEFAAPKALYLDTHTYPANLLALLAHRKAMQPYLSPATGPVAEAFQHLVSATGATLEGWANVRLGREREGEALFERVLRDYPDNPTARGELAHILVKRGLAATSNGNLAEAKATLERAIRLSPSSQAHLALGNVYYMGQHWEAATSQYRLTLHFKPESAVAHKSLSYALIMEGSKEGEARDHLLRALALNPTDPEAKQLRELADRLSKAKAASTP